MLNQNSPFLSIRIKTKCKNYIIFVLLSFLIITFFFSNPFDLNFYIFLSKKKDYENKISNTWVKRKVEEFPLNLSYYYYQSNIFLNLTYRQNMFSFHPLTKDYIPSYFFGFLTGIDNAKYTFAHFKNVYANYANSFIINDTEYSRNIGNGGGGEHGIVLGDYPHVISLGNVYTFAFGHWIYDVLGPLMLIPLEILKISFIIAGGSEKFTIPTLETLFDIPKTQIIVLKNKQWIFCENLYTIAQPPTFLSYFWSLKNLSLKIFNKFNINPNELPTLYCLSNRKENKPRYLKNFNEFTENVKNKFNKYNWEIIPDQFNTIEESILKWSKIKVIFCPAGSNLAYMIFMKEKSGLCVVQGDRMTTAELAVSQVMNLFYYGLCIKGMSHFDGNGGYLDINIALESLEKTIFATDNGYYPK